MAGLLVGLGVDREPVGVAAVGDEALGAVDDVLVAACWTAVVRMPRDVGAGVGLGQAEGRQTRLIDEPPEVLPLELLAASEEQRAGREPVRAERRADPRAAPGELLLDQAAFEVGGARASVDVRDLRVHQPQLPGLLDDRLRPGAVSVVLPRDGSDLLRGEVVRHLAHAALLFSEGEVNH